MEDLSTNKSHTSHVLSHYDEQVPSVRSSDKEVSESERNTLVPF